MNSETASLFHLIEWKDAVEKTFVHKARYIMALRDGNICGILPLFEIKSRLFGHSLISIPYGVYGGISSHDKEACDALKISAETLAGLTGVDYLELRQRNAQSVCPSDHFIHGSPNSNCRTKDLYVTFEREIFGTVDENFDAIPRKQRRMIRQGVKNGLSSKIGGIEDIEKFYFIYARNVRDLGSPVFPIAFFRALMENFNDSFILSVWKDGEMVAGVLTFVFKDTLMPYYGGALREYFHYSVNDFMYWELMRYGCEKGYKSFDFGRSKRNAGSYHFKRHWGFEPADLNYYYYLVKARDMPNVSPANPKYKLLINIWKRLPVTVTNWLGPKLVTGIP
jgi:FemAB-related protein (PEP-CTERM system-associated)